MATTFTAINGNILDHMTNPRNIGEIENADGFAVIGDPRCGDHIKVWIRVKDKKITDFKYKVFGCWGAISTTSVVSELAVGRTIAAAFRLSDDDVIRELGGIPEDKQHCSLLGIQGLQMAIVNFLIHDNHKRYLERIHLYRSRGYDIPKLREIIVDRLSNVSQDATILDVGTGKGHLAIAMARSGKKCTSVDISSEEIRIAQLNALYFQVDDLIEFQQQDACQLNFESSSFDVVVSCALFHHLENPELVLNEMLRVCKADGQLIISDLNKHGLEILDHIHHTEGREHVAIGWRLQKITNWFEEQGYPTEQYVNDCEDTIVIHLERSK